MLLLLSCALSFLKKMESLLKTKTMFSQHWAENKVQMNEI